MFERPGPGCVEPPAKTVRLSARLRGSSDDLLDVFHHRS
jgi:hypothetical protein